MTLKPESIGSIPEGLSPYHHRFLMQLRDAIKLLAGYNQANPVSGRAVTADEVRSRPGSQAVVIDDLDALGLLNGQDESMDFAKIFMHMGAL